MPLGYNPGEKEGEAFRKAVPGTYGFEVHDANELEFQSGNTGLKIQLDVYDGGTRPRKVFENFVYLPQSLWRLEQFMECIGKDFKKPCEADELLGREGVADFILTEPNEEGKVYLTVDNFSEAGATAPDPEKGPGNLPPRTAAPAKRASAAHASAAAPEVEDDEDIPF